MQNKWKLFAGIIDASKEERIRDSSQTVANENEIKGTLHCSITIATSSQKEVNKGLRRGQQDDQARSTSPY